jgi:type I restriction enzyme S subunit
MESRWRQLELGKLLQQVNRRVAVEDLQIVPFAGVRWYALGVYARDEVPASGVKTTHLNRIEEGDIVYNRMWATKAAFGVVGSEESGCLVTNDFPLFVTLGDVVPEFLGLVFQMSSFQSAASLLATGTTERRRLKEKDFLSIEIGIPTAVEQRRIVDLVSSVDSYIDALHQQADSARVARKAVLHELLSAGVNDWTKTTLGDVATWASGGTPKSDEAAYYDGDIPWCVIGDLTEGEVFRTEKYISKEGLKNSSAKIAEPGAVMIAMYGASIGRTGIVGRPMATNQAIAFAYPRVDFLDNRFLLLFLQTQKPHFVEAGQGAAQPNISQTVLKAWSIPLPPLVEQRRIVEIASSMDEVIQLTERAVEHAKQLRSGLLSDLLSGEHEIPTSYDHLMKVA